MDKSARGDLPPDFFLKDQDGKIVKMTDYQGGRKILGVWRKIGSEDTVTGVLA